MYIIHSIDFILHVLAVVERVKERSEKPWEILKAVGKVRIIVQSFFKLDYQEIKKKHLNELIL